METLEQTLSIADVDELCDEIVSAMERGTHASLMLPGIDQLQNDFLLGRAEQFEGQCQFLLARGLTTHPCLLLGEAAVPIEFSPDEIAALLENGSDDPEAIIAGALAKESGTNVAKIDISGARREFGRRLAQFVAAIIKNGWFGGGHGGGRGGGRGGGGDDDGGDGGRDGRTSGIEITVNSNTHGLQVVYSEHFMIRGKRSENAFGEALTSPVKGRITQAGLYYFGTADNVTTTWARFTFEIPPTRIVNLMH